MKIGFLFLSMLAMALSCWSAVHRRTRGSRLSWRDKRRIAVQSVLAGIVVYFLLVLTAAIYMAFASM